MRSYSQQSTDDFSRPAYGGGSPGGRFSFQGYNAPSGYVPASARDY